MIAGGESGANARPSHPDWFRGLRDQCHERGIPYFFKQWGGYWEIAHETTDEYCEAVQLDADDPDDAKLFKKSRDKLITIDGRVFDSLDDIPDDTRCRHVTRISTKAAGNILDGRQHLAFPDGLSFSAASPANTRQSIQFHPFV